MFPGAKTIHDSKPAAAAAASRDGQLSPAQAAVQAAVQAANQPKVAAAQTVVDAICHKQVCSIRLYARRLLALHDRLNLINKAQVGLTGLALTKMKIWVKHKEKVDVKSSIIF